MSPSLVLINPWIYDFAAYDLWAKPLGLLYIAGYLRNCGFNVHLVDCLDTHHPGMEVVPGIKRPKRHSYGTGKFWREKIPKPAALKGVKRAFARYGVSPSVLESELKKIRNPAAILVTSLMTYWYPGVQEVIHVAKRVQPHVPVILGGIYARLCFDHAVNHSGADHVSLASTPDSVLTALGEFSVEAPHIPEHSSPLPYPAFDLLHQIDYICLQASTGCPCRCQYCAAGFLNPDFLTRDPGEVVEEIVYWHKKHRVTDFAFYDDALLMAPDNHFQLLLENLARLNCQLRFHTPNAVHAAKVTKETARLMRISGFRTIRLGLETADFSDKRTIDNKINEGDVERAILNLRRAGYTGRQIGVYILIGLPGQSVESVVDTIHLISASGAMPLLSEYSPIPHTGLWEKAVSNSPYPLSSDPLFHNNTILPCWDEKKKNTLPALKKLVMEVRKNNA